MRAVSTFILVPTLAVLVLGCGSSDEDGGSDGPYDVVGSAEGPTLTIALRWDRDPARNVFDFGDCKSAEVDWTEWRLRLGEGRAVTVYEGPCANVFDVPGLAPGDYGFDIIAYHDDVAGWSAWCPGLHFEGVDVTVECDVAREE